MKATITITIDIDLAKKLESYCYMVKKKKSTVIESIIKDYFAEEGMKEDLKNENNKDSLRRRQPK